MERLGATALAGQLTLAEFQELQGQAGKHAPPLRSLPCALRAARKRAAAVAGLPSDVLADLDALVSRVEGVLGVAARVATLAGRRSAKGFARVSGGKV